MNLGLLATKFLSFLGKVYSDPNNTTEWTKEVGGNKYKDGINYGDAPTWVIEIIAPIINILNSLLIPVIILLGTAGTIYAIVLGVQYSKAETADKRDEAKKRLINAVIGIVIMLVALILIKIFVANAASIFGWVKDTSDTTTTA